VVAGIWPKVVERIGRLGLSSFGALAQRQARALCVAVAAA
jgi:hypothetical protein